MRAPVRPWTALEREALKKWVLARVPTKEIARRLGRSARGVEGMALYWGYRQGVRVEAAARRVHVKRLHGRGLTPWEMARRLGVGPSVVYCDHRRLGLAPHRIDPAERGRRSVGACRRAHGQTAGQIRRERERVAAFTAGWPAVPGSLAARLDDFYRHGPATVREHGARHAPAECRRNTEDRLRKLAEAGHLVVVGRAAPRARVFDLAPDVRERRRRVLLYRSPGVPA